MSSLKVRLEYSELTSISGGFRSQQQETQQLFQQLKNNVEQLHGGGWVGDAADKWYSKMEGELLPAVSKLINAQGQLGDGVQKIANLIRQADEGTKGFFANILAGKMF